MLHTYIDHYKSDDRAYHIFLGPPVQAPPAESERWLMIDCADPGAMAAAQQIDLGRCVHGLAIVINSDTYACHAATVWTIQRYLTFLYCKYIFYPANAPTIPDKKNILPTRIPALLQKINVCRNLPILARAPLANALAGVAAGMPALILLSAPSKHRVTEHLTNLHRRCITICIPREIATCQQQEITPDFVVQLDTRPNQVHFYPPGDVYTDTVLVGLHTAPLYKIAHKFRHTVALQRFCKNANDDAFRLKRSYLSSLFSCLSLAKLIGCTDI